MSRRKIDLVKANRACWQEARQDGARSSEGGDRPLDEELRTALDGLRIDFNRGGAGGSSGRRSSGRSDAGGDMEGHGLYRIRRINPYRTPETKEPSFPPSHG
jgi:hypothetical protein